jgi:hypothetical protein
MSYEEMYEKIRKFMDFIDGTFGVLDALYNDTFNKGSLAPPPLPPISPPGSPPSSPPGSPPGTPREPPKKIDSVLKKTKGINAKEEIKKIVGWTSNIENTNFNMLKDMFSKHCTRTRIPNTFLSDINKLGSSPYSHHKFRLNWIILLAFHSYYNNETTLKTVGKLIASLYNAFLGWLATSSYKDTFMRLFNGTLQIDPTTKYSEIFNKQLNASLNSENSSYNDVYTLVQNINNKMCELQEDRNPAIDVQHNDEYDDEMNDPDFVSSEEDESVHSNGDTSPRRRAAAAEARLLSPSGVPPGQRRRPIIPTLPLSVPHGEPNPADVIDSDFSDSDVEGSSTPPTSHLGLPIGQDGTQSARTDERRYMALKHLIKDQGVRVGNTLPTKWVRPLSSHSQSQPGSVPPLEGLRLGTLSNLHTRANKAVENPGQLAPMTEEALRALQQQQQQQTSEPLFIRRKAVPRQINAGYSVDQLPPHPTPASTPASTLTPAPPSDRPPPGLGRSASSSRRIPQYGGPRGGNNKKRTRKHKKHTSISASRRPTRRRRIPPTEGHKYTRKRPRT